MEEKQDLISRQAAINTLMSIVKSASLRNRNVYSTAKKCLFEIEALPTVDAVPVIRCKECKYGEQDDYGWICTNIDGGIMGDGNGNGFCCEGERREE